MNRLSAIGIGVLFAAVPLATRGQSTEPPPSASAEAKPEGSAVELPSAVNPNPAPETPPPAPIERSPPGPTPAALGHAPALQEFNRVSVYGAPTLGTFNRGLGVYLGFPMVGARAAIGASSALDLGLGFDSFYGSMNELRVFGKRLLHDDRFWTISVALEGGAAFFAQRPEAEGHGPRWLTGRRNFNVEGGAILSYRGASVQSARLFVDARYQLAIDTQPYAQTPLGGVPPPVQFGHNLPVRMGAEMPFSPRASFLFVFGFDVHGRSLDSRFMPALGVGLVTGV